MIAQHSIDTLMTLTNIVDVIGEFVQLKKQGSTYSGACPFHDEKTDSFKVSASKNVYRCFGCGKSGRVVKFMMEHKNMTFPQAIEFIAGKYNFTLEYTSEAPAPEVLEEKDQMLTINAIAAEKYASQTNPYILTRFTSEDIAIWNIGFAPLEPKFLTTTLINKSLYLTAVKLGLLGEKEGTVYDKYRNRVMFPIMNNNDECIGFGARAMPGTDTKKYAKYLNSSDSIIYNKSRTLYGLHLASNSISKANLAYLVEGYTDVIAMHRNGLTNTIATCGTALTEDQCRILRKYCDTIVLLRDSDAAGNKAAIRDTELLMSFGFRILRVDLPDGEDPESFFNYFHTIGYAAREAIIGMDCTAKQYIETFTYDAIVALTDNIIESAKNDIPLRAKAIFSATKLFNTIPHDGIRQSYTENFAKKHKIKPAELKSAGAKKVAQGDMEALTEDDEALKKLNPAQREEYMRFGFFERSDGAKTGYYFRAASGSSFTARTNFIVEPLYHIYGEDNRRMIKVRNGITAEVIIEMPSKNMLSLENFCSALYNEGYFLPKEGFTRDHLLRIHNKIGNQYPRVYQINALGWQPEDFFAFQNKIYKPATHDKPGELANYNEYGIATVGERLFLSPSLSRSNENLREGENIYENDLYLQHKQAPISFEEWADMMVAVYEKNAWTGIAWAIATIMKDVMEKTARVPHLNPYGQKGSGKSEFGNSIQYLFFSGKDSFGDLYKPMNLNQGTDFAFFNRYERFSNCPNILNEFDENAIKDEWFRAIKSAYDGEGREKGKGKSNQTTSQKIRSTTVIIGQYLGTKDDNSVLSRSLPLPFALADSRQETQVATFRKLKEMEDKGLSGILCDLLDLRATFVRKFPETFFAHVNTMQKELTAEGTHTIDRILKNVSMMIACIDLASERYKLPFTLEEYRTYSKEFIKTLTRLITKTSKLSEFWKVIESLIDQDILEHGFDFDIKLGVLELKVLDGSTDTKTISFGEPTDIIHLRFGAIHSYYEKEFRSRTGGKATNEETLKLYLQEQKYYVGNKKSHKFHSVRSKKSVNTSCIVLNLSKMDVNLIRTEDGADSRTDTVGMVGVVMTTPTRALDNEVYSFNLRCTRKVSGEGQSTVYEEFIVRCFWQNASATTVLTVNDRVTVSGKMAETRRNHNIFYSLSISELQKNGELFTSNAPIQTADDLPF